MTDTTAPVRILVGDCREMLRTLPAESVHCCVTSPPYFQLRDYGHEAQIGQEATPAEFVAELVSVFREVWRVLRNDGTLWLNLGDSYASAWACNRRSVVGAGSLEHGKRENRPNRLGGGLKEKDLIGIPWRVAFALQDDGWYLRSEIIWHKPAPMPESVRDRPTKSHEHIFLLTKQERYYYDADAIRERAGADLRNCRDVWTLNPEPSTEDHYAAYPSEIPRRAILAGTSEHGVCAACGTAWTRAVERTAMVVRRTDWGDKAGNRTASSGTMLKPPTCRTVGWKPGCDCYGGVIPATVLDPFGGTGTTAAVAVRHGRQAILCELNPEYAEISRRRCDRETGLFQPHRTEVVAAPAMPVQEALAL
jgi:DNA modification methylase